MCVAVLAGLSACRQPNPEWLGRAEGSAASDTSETSMGATDPTDPTGPSPGQCAPEPVLGVGDCPEECSACDGGRCLIECATDGCEDAWIECPDAWPCDIRCAGKDACKDADLECASAGDCTVDCRGESACEDATVHCGSGSCAVTCGPQGDACDALALECGEADSTVTCANAQDVTVVEDGSPCACEALGCG